VRDADGQTTEWEEFYGNRVIEIVGDTEAYIEDSFGEYLN
jgi:hypothetical protein